MNDYGRCFDVGSTGVQRVFRLLEQEFEGTASHVLGPRAQRIDGDIRIARPDGSSVRVEVKTDQTESGNIFFEEWSNFLRTPGWGATLESEILAYYFTRTNDLYLMNLNAVRDWLSSGHIATIGLRFERREQRQYDQRNKTVGILVPLSQLAIYVGYRRINITSGVRETVEPRDPNLGGRAMIPDENEPTGG